MTETIAHDAPSNIWSCRLCWRIACGIFLTIFLVASVVVFISVMVFERDRIFAAEHDALLIARAIFRSVELEDLGTEEFPRQASILSESSVLSGMQILDHNSQVVAGFGELPGKFTVPKLAYLRDVTVRRPIKDGARVDIYWPDFRTRTPYFVVARVDTHEIGAEVRTYAWRIVGTAALATVTLMVAVMAVLAKLLLNPILSLRLGLQEIMGDPDAVTGHEIPLSSEDEIRDVISAVNTLSARLTNAVRKNGR